MADEKRIRVVIPLHGLSTGQRPVRALDTKLGNELLDSLGGDKEILRASHVEPGGGLRPEALEWLYNETDNEDRQEGPLLALWGPLRIAPEHKNSWFADLTVVRGPVLGPFSDRAAALAAEEAWIYSRHIPLEDHENKQDTP